MRLPARFGVFALFAALFFGSPATGQCGPCDSPYPCPTGVCEVTCESELLAALACMANPNTTTCTHIRIPVGCTLDLNSANIFIGSNHSGMRLEIAGTLRFVGTPSDSEKPFR